MTGLPPLIFDHFSIGKLRERWENEEIVINEKYQRREVWKPKKKRSLIDSILYGAPIGVLILLERKDGKIEVLDGQQRIKTIVDYRSDGFANNNKKKFANLDKTEQNEFEAYPIYYLELKSFLSDEQVSDYFIRLQEGERLNTGEKVHAFVGQFKESYIKSFNEVNSLFSKVSNSRFKATLLAAELLALELDANFEKNIFPSLNFEKLREINEKYKNEIPEKKLVENIKVLKFIETSLKEKLSLVQFRDWIGIYLLASYLVKEKEDTRYKEQFSGTVIQFLDKIETFSIYDTEPPKNMTLEEFQLFLNYKNVARKATSADSVSGRFKIILDIFRRYYPVEIKIPSALHRSIEELLENDESKDLEFKASMRWDYKKGECDKYDILKEEIVKTVAALMNTDGGTLLIGVQDRTKKVLGIEKDFDCFNEDNDWDTWLRTFVNLINTYIGKEASRFYRVSKETIDGKSIAIVDIEKSNAPIYISIKGNKEFWIKIENTKTKLNIEEAVKYTRGRF